MGLTDARGVATSATNPDSLDAYEDALALFQRYRGDPTAVIDAALENDPGFALGHIFRAEITLCMWERSALGGVEASLHQLRKLHAGCTPREQAHIAAIDSWLSGAWESFRSQLDRLLADEPRDALALQVGHLADFFHGDRDNLRGRILRALPAWSPSLPGYPLLLGMLAFGLEECGDYGRAEEAGRHAIALEPDDCWAHHAVTHVLEMEARQAEGIAWMESREPHWAQTDNMFSYHNWWHTALFHLDQDQVDEALAIYDRGVRPHQGETQVEMLDAAALLWRLSLRGIDTGDRWEELAAAYEERVEDGFYAFNDAHAMMAYVATGRASAATRLLSAMANSAESGTTNARMTREAGLPVARGLQAFGEERYGDAVDLLLPVRYRAHVFGGSHAQRDVIHRTLIEAALRDGKRCLARALIAERTALKPHCAYSWRLSKLARA